MLSYSAYVAEVFRAGIESVHPSQRLAGRSLGLSYGQTLRHVVLPQAVRRVVPPLMNDLVSLQKDSGLIAVLGVIDAIRKAQIETSLDFNYTPYVVAGALFGCLTIPMARFTDHFARKKGYHGRDGARCQDAAISLLSSTASASRSATTWSSATSTSRSSAASASSSSARSGSGKSTLLRCVNLLEVVDDGRITLEAATSPTRGRHGCGARPDGRRLPGLQPLPPPRRARQHHPRPVRVHKVARDEARSSGPRDARPGGPRRPGAGPARRALRGQQQRVAIARALVDQPAADAARRGHLARSTPSWSARCSTCSRELKGEGVTMLAQHPRDGLRARGRRHRSASSTTAVIHEQRDAPTRCSATRSEERTRAFLSRIRA